MIRYAWVLLAGWAAWAQTDPREIVRRSVRLDDRTAALARDYIYVSHSVLRELDGSGRLRKTRDETREILFIGGKPYRRLTQKDGMPLQPKEERAEQARLDKAIAEANKLTPEERARRLEEYRNHRAKERESLKDIPDAFDFRLLREEKIGGRDAYVIQAEPRADYRGKHRDLLSKMHGVLWIGKGDDRWIRAEAETLDTISFGLFIARLAKGSHLEFEQTLVNGEIWLPLRAKAKVSARLGLVKKFNLEEEATFSAYRKFQTDSRIVSTSEAQQ